jgi:hypothetical protein
MAAAGAMAGSGLAAPAPILAAMFVLTDGPRTTRFPIGLTVAVIRGQRATRPARDHAKRPRRPVAKGFIAAGAWDPPALAPKGNVYFGIGNMYKYSVAVSHPSTRLYVDGAVALDASSGKLRRDFQPVPDDFCGSPCAAARAGCRVVELVAAERPAGAAAYKEAMS